MDYKVEDFELIWKKGDGEMPDRLKHVVYAAGREIVARMSQIEVVNKLIKDVPEAQLTEVIDFLMFLRLKNDKSLIQDFVNASMSSTGFWDNPDDEVWDNV